MPGYEANNDILYTTRLRLNLAAEVADNVSFAGRLSMYKPWGDSSGDPGLQRPVQLAEHRRHDGERAQLATSCASTAPTSTGRTSPGRRSTCRSAVVPRPAGRRCTCARTRCAAARRSASVIDFQFDGITAGWHITDNSTLRLCYGLGYESGFGSAEQLKQPADRLKDAHFFGVNWDVYNTEQTHVQAHGRARLRRDRRLQRPGRPAGQPGHRPAGRRADRHALHAVGEPGRHRPRQRCWRCATTGPFDCFASVSYMKSDPEHRRPRPFGGLFCDPFETPEEQDATDVLRRRPLQPAQRRRPRSASSTTTARSTGSTSPTAADDILARQDQHPRRRVGAVRDPPHHRRSSSPSSTTSTTTTTTPAPAGTWAPPRSSTRRRSSAIPTYDTADKVALSFTARF